MKSCLFVFLGILACIVVGVIFILRPKGLGVSYSPTDLESIYNKVGVAFEPLPSGTPSGKSLIVSGSHPVDQTFSSEEISAAADNRAKQYAYFPFRSVRIRVNSDGSVEGSATVQYKDAVRYLVALGVAPKDIEEGAKKFNIPNATLPVYLKVSGSVMNNKTNIVVNRAEIARVGISQNLVNDYTPALNGFIDSIIRSRMPSYNIQKLSVENGKIHFTGNAPDKEQAVKSL
ncbi:hypothetical protein HY947_05445 [Candidatus Gottesmanbacteria bacterium]|nr:hypothetical protein [Candidatus Gottesmanbacteria bacterium]